ncbi:PIN domain-containing protein [Nocardia arthritidis]|uniref:PIN domain-containing protein n=1 Tax=Nocardia arthritidis TaxID=228602 RepID=A0A6G9YJR0_9NOCA|nr:PIN domain-containing protein [Nocardia arthritidis]QIS13442.1 PIN domain-containing protein [Nocardia arthritidis]
MRGYLIDNSVWSRVDRSAAVATRVEQLLRTFAVYTTTPLILERCYSGKDAATFRALREEMDLLPRLDPDAEVSEIALSLQADLWAHKPRSAGAFDILIAAVAIRHGLTIVHYDADYEHLAEVSALGHEWVVARGSID